LSAINTDSDTFSNHLYDSYSLSVTSEFNELFNDSNAFYFFTFQPVENNANFKDFYIAENKIDNFQIMEALENLNEITITQLDYYKELQSMDFIVVNDKEKYNEAKSSTEEKSLNIRMNNGALINHISFLNEKSEYINVDNHGKKPFLLFVNPFRVKGKSYSLNFWSLENYNFGLFNEYQGDIKPFEDNEFTKHLNKLYAITKTIKSGFKDMNEEQVKEFKRLNGDISDLKNYSNQYLKDILDSYLYNGKFDKYLKFKSYILSASNYLISDYCWKGGNNNEYMFYTPFTLDFEESGLHLSSRMINKQKSDYTSGGYMLWSNVTNEFLNGNTYKHFGYNIQLPLLGEQLEEIDYSQNPVDFNNKSYNLCYPVYCFENYLNFNE
ncbi:hypothetical protein ACX1NA_03365, partial [Mycoplasma sp. VS276A1]